MTRILHAFGIAPMSLAVDLVSSVSSAPDPCAPTLEETIPMAGTGSLITEWARQTLWSSRTAMLKLTASLCLRHDLQQWIGVD